MRTQPWLEGKYFSWQRSPLFWGLITKQVSTSFHTDVQCRTKKNWAITHTSQWLAYVLWHSKKATQSGLWLTAAGHHGENTHARRDITEGSSRFLGTAACQIAMESECCTGRIDGRRSRDLLWRCNRYRPTAKRRNDAAFGWSSITVSFLSSDSFEGCRRNKACRLNPRFRSLKTTKLYINIINITL